MVGAAFLSVRERSYRNTGREGQKGHPGTESPQHQEEARCGPTELQTDQKRSGYTHGQVSFCAQRAHLLQQQQALPTPRPWFLGTTCHILGKTADSWAGLEKIQDRSDTFLIRSRVIRKEVLEN